MCCVFARFYIGCNMCAEWFHGSCVGVSANNVQNLSSFICQNCSSKNTKADAEELHCICQTPYDESRYGLCLYVIDLILNNNTNVLILVVVIHTLVVSFSVSSLCALYLQ